MREAFGTSFLFIFVITFLGLFIAIFSVSISYTKAFKVKNKIIEIVEKHGSVLDTDVTNGNRLNSKVEDEINVELSKIGYRIGQNSTCAERDSIAAISKNSNYEYCIYEHTTHKGKYYGVVAYMYYEIPLIGSKLKFPVYGETKIIGDILGGGK